MNKSIIKFLSFFLLICFLSGCMHYTSGTGSKLSFSTIYISSVKNNTLAHHIQSTLGAQIREKIAEHPQLKLVNSAENAEVCLKVKITDYEQSVATTMPDDSIRAKSFTLKIAAQCSLYDNRTQKYLFENHTVYASIDSRAEGDYHWNKTKTIPQLSSKLAEEIYDIVCKPW